MVLTKSRIDTELASKRIQWSFNPPHASHRGGVWERLIRSVKRVLKSVCNQQMLDDDTLITTLVGIERILNNRPIVRAMDGDPGSTALTPNNLLLLRSNSGLPLESTVAECYRSRWKQSNYLAGVFWRRWIREYLPLLQTRQKWTNRIRQFHKGDVVLIVSEALSRDSWPLGIVDRCIPGSDGLVRTVDIRTSTGVIRRDIRKVCLLEGDSLDSVAEGGADGRTAVSLEGPTRAI